MLRLFASGSDVTSERTTFWLLASLAADHRTLADSFSVTLCVQLDAALHCQYDVFHETEAQTKGLYTAN